MDGRPRSDRALLAGFAIALLGGLWLLFGFLFLPEAVSWGYDYQSYVNAAERLAATGTLYPEWALEAAYRTGSIENYYYAPPLGIAIGPFDTLFGDLAVPAWYVLHVAALAAACALVPVPVWVRLATFGVVALSYGAMRDLVLGNISVMLLLPLAVAWRWLDRPAGSMAQAVAMAVRPMLGVLLIWQTLRRQWRAVAWTIGAGLGLIVLSLPFVGFGGYVDYFTVLGNLSGLTGEEHNLDLSTWALAMGAGEGIAQLALLASYALGIAAIGLSLRRDAEIGFVVTSMASLVLVPLLWDHYLAMLMLPAALLAARGRPWGLALPLLSWLPALALPLVVMAGLWLPFAARDKGASDAAGAVPPAPAPGGVRA
ncbi:MAG: glycosyltransferase family 87 protein [Candidatus Limnocylindrales bacterium]